MTQLIFLFSIALSLLPSMSAKAGCGDPGCNMNIAPWGPSSAAQQLPIYPMRGCGPLGCPMKTQFRSGIIYPLSPAPGCPQMRVEPDFPVSSAPFPQSSGFQPL